MILVSAMPPVLVRDRAYSNRRTAMRHHRGTPRLERGALSDAPPAPAFMSENG